MFSTSSPTYPASVSVVASAMAKGTCEDAGQGLGQQGLARAGGADEEDVGLLELHVAAGLLLGQPLVVVVDGHGERFLACPGRSRTRPGTS